MTKSDEERIIPYLELEGIVSKDSGYNFRCPVCGDSKKSKSKKRGWILTGRDHLVYYCFNCGYSTSFKNFVREFYKDIFERFYSIERVNLKDKELSRETKETDKLFFKLTEVFESVYKHREHLEYCKSRMIPERIIDKLKVCNHEYFVAHNMLIFPFYYKNTKYVYGFQGRKIDVKDFYTYLPSNNLKVYNMYNVKFNKPVYVLESIIDSLFVNNSIAMLGSDLNTEFLKTIDPVMVFDNDVTGKEKTEKYLKLGHKCVVWPRNLIEKDINEMVLKGKKINLEELVCSGNQGLLKLKYSSR